jgi:hypothetical protein
MLRILRKTGDLIGAPSRFCGMLRAASCLYGVFTAWQKSRILSFNGTVGGPSIIFHGALPRIQNNPERNINIDLAQFFGRNRSCDMAGT